MGHLRNFPQVTTKGEVRLGPINKAPACREVGPRGAPQQLSGGRAFLGTLTTMPSTRRFRERGGDGKGGFKKSIKITKQIDFLNNK